MLSPCELFRNRLCVAAAGSSRQRSQGGLVYLVNGRRGNAKFEDVKDLVAGTRGARVYDSGDTDAGIWSAGQTQGLIHDIPSCKELMDAMMAEAEKIIRARLDRMVA